MIAGTIFTQLVTTLEESPSLEYFKKVFKGLRVDKIVPESLPCIMIEPVRDGELDKKLSQTQDVYFTLDLYAFSSNVVGDFEKTIVGDLTYKGILDINNDIRAVLMSSYSLGGNVIDVRIGDTNFDSLEINKYPTRGLVMPLRILYRQFNGV